MKIRIKGNSVRLRLTRPEVEQLIDDGYLEEHTSFGHSSFVYALQSVEGQQELTAAFEGGKLTVNIPAAFVKDWAVNDVVGFDGHMPAGEGQRLFLLVEKDFKCLDETTEDQSDNYENPNKFI
jgi:hypothetical protein